MTCEHPPAEGHRFCVVCGKLQDPDGLKDVSLLGFVGVKHSTSSAINDFWESGDPNTPGL